MGKACFVCKKTDYLHPDLSFHRFPTDINIARTWLSILHLAVEAENLPEYARLCSLHFLATDFEFRGTNRRKFLKKGAMPIPSEIVEVRSSSDASTESTPPKRPKWKKLRFAISEGAAGASYNKSESSSTLTASEGSNLEEPCSLDNINIETMKEVEATRGDLSGILRSSSSASTSEGSQPGECSLGLIQLREEDNVSLGVASLHSSTTLSASETEGIKRKRDEQNVFSLKRPVKRKRSNVLNLSSSDFSTPRKAKRCFRKVKTKLHEQQHKIRMLQQSVRRLRARVTTLQKLVDVLKEKRLITENSESTILSSLPSAAAPIFQRMLKGHTKQKYSPELRSFALTLSFYSPKAYNFVRRTFNRSLPHLNTLSKWYQTVDGSPGWTKEALAALKLKTEDAGKQIICNLVLDEMAIRKRVEWTGKKFTGYVDVGTGINADTLPEAKEALTFMLVCVNGSWKIPVGYFLLNGLCASEKASLIKSCLQFINESGVKVLSMTFDGTATNFQMAKHLGADFTNVNSLKTSFKHPVTNDDIFIFPDACHMIKLIRNCLGAYKVLYDGEGNRIAWEYLEKLVALQTDEGLRAGNKLKQRHIQFAKEKMKVRIATQTLSKSVSDALLYLESQNEDFANAGATAKFLKMFNDLFDIFNSRNRWAKYLYKKPLSSSTKDIFFNYLEQIKTYIVGLSVNGSPITTSGRKTGFMGFLICIESVKNYYNQYVENKGFLKYLLTYKLSQDHLELFFGAIRSKGGFNNNPTARQFEAAYKRLIVHNEIRGGDTGNIINLDATSILCCSSRSITVDENGEELQNKQDSIAFDEQLKKNVDDLEFAYSPSWLLTDYVLDVVAYIAGFVVKSLKQLITCGACLKILECPLLSLSRLQTQKEYRNLTKASQFVTEVCQAGEKYFRFFNKTTGIFNKNIKNLSDVLVRNTLENLPPSVLDLFGAHLYDDDEIDSHWYKLSKLILIKFFKLRIHHETNKMCDSVPRIRSNFTKLILFKNQ